MGNRIRKCLGFVLAMSMLILLVSCAESENVIPSSIEADSKEDIVVSDSELEKIQSKVVPDGQLLSMKSWIDGTTEEMDCILICEDEYQRQTKIYVPVEKRVQRSVSFVSENMQLIAVVGQPEEGVLHGTISVDGGETWDFFDIELETDFLPFSLYIGFTSMQDGWILYDNNVMQENADLSAHRYAFLQTDDSGRTWDVNSVFNVDYGYPTFQFASLEVGWAFFIAAEHPVVFETFDGGKTWNPAEIEFLDFISEGAYSYVVESVWWNGNAWEFVLFVGKSGGHPSRSKYNFIWNQEQSGWVLKDSEWELPSTVNAVEFANYIERYLYPPLEYDSAIGLGNTPDILVLLNTREHLRRINKHSLYGEDIPYEKILEIAEYMYDDSEFDIVAATEYWCENYEVEKTETGLIYTGYWLRGENEPGIEVVDVCVLEEEVIEVVVVNKYYDNIGSNLLIDEIYQKCLVKPIQLDGVQYFTLLSSEVIPAPEN